MYYDILSFRIYHKPNRALRGMIVSLHKVCLGVLCHCCNPDGFRIFYDYRFDMLQRIAVYPLGVGTIDTGKSLDNKIYCVASIANLVWLVVFFFVKIALCMIFVVSGNTSLTFQQAESFHPLFVGLRV